MVRNVLRTDFWPTITRESKSTQIVLVCERHRVFEYTKEFSRTQVVIEGLPPVQVTFFEQVISFLARNGLATGTNQVMQHRAFISRESRIPPLLKRAIGVLFGRFHLFQSCVRYLDSRIASSSVVKALFDRYKPDMVFSTTIINTSVDIPVIREAKRRCVHVVAMTRSWDNLTSLGFLRFLPDHFLTQNRFLKDVVTKFHYLPGTRVSVIGIPHYDLYAHKELIERREKLFARLKLDPSRKLILYAAIGDFLFEKEGEMASVLEELLESGKVRIPAQVIFRAHPSFRSPLERMGDLRWVRSDSGTEHSSVATDNREMTTRDMVHLINTLYHADVIVTAGSTMMIDAVMFDKPTITIAFDGKSSVPYWSSCARFYDHFTHIMELLKTGGVQLVKTPDELALRLNSYLANPSKDAEGRRLIRERFGDPMDGASGKRLARVVLAMYAHAK